ncbi:MAG: YdeI/OmpD-associated family protein [Gammaproteobacteria bacterium]
MTRATSKVCFKAKLMRPAAPARGSSWTFLILPKSASARLPSRGMTTVAGTMNGHAFQATLEPDGRRSHWLKVNRKMREAAGADVGDMVALEIAPVAQEPEPKVPADFRRALTAQPKARAVWSDITPVARRDWIFWIVSAKRPETRARRIDNACDMLASGKRRVCCFDRSGIYSQGLGAPEPAD